MATIVKRKLASSTDGKAIKIAQTSTAGTAIHTAVAGTTEGTFDEVWLFAQNNHTADVALTIEFGGASAPDDNIIVTVPSKGGSMLVVAGLILQNGATVKAFASTANVISITGYVNRITD